MLQTQSVAPALLELSEELQSEPLHVIWARYWLCNSAKDSEVINSYFFRSFRHLRGLASYGGTVLWIPRVYFDIYREDDREIMHYRFILSAAVLCVIILLRNSL